MWESFKSYYRLHPLRIILLFGLLFRLLSAVYSKGYAFTDDHYFVIEEAQQWISQGDEERDFFNPNIVIKDRLSHGSLYTTSHYILFQIYRYFGFLDPMAVMITVRLFHAVYSLFIIFLGYKIARLLGNQRTAIQVSWILALLWFMPFLSVRNLVEMVCIPPLMGASYLVLKNERKWLMWAGMLASVAFALRFQTILFSGMFGIILLYRFQWRDAIGLLTGFILGSLVLLGLLDYVLFGTPFYELVSYIEYNATHSGEYPNGPWYQYLLVIMGMFLILPSVIWVFAIIRKFKEYAVLLLPTIMFLAFHSAFPNKQERFILPIIPFIIIIGVTAWSKIPKSPTAMRWNLISNRFFWILNTPLLLLLSVASTRTAKMDAMYYLFKQKDAKHFAIESTHRNYMEYMPRFYGNYWKPYQHILPSCASNCFMDSVASGVHPFPDYVLFFDSEQLDQRVTKLQKEIQIEPVVTIYSSWLDRLIPKLNPIVKSQEIFIYRVVEKKRKLPASAGASAVKAATPAKATKAS